MAALNDRRILVLTTNFGTESDELTKPIAALREAGATVTVAATEPGVVKTLAGDRDPGPEVPVDTTYEQVRAVDFDALVIPGGTLNADHLRTDRQERILDIHRHERVVLRDKNALARPQVLHVRSLHAHRPSGRVRHPSTAPG